MPAQQCEFCTQVAEPGETTPGMDDALFDDITVPTLIIRGAAKRTVRWGRVQLYNMFDTWVQAAPAILDFLHGLSETP